MALSPFSELSGSLSPKAALTRGLVGVLKEPEVRVYDASTSFQALRVIKAKLLKKEFVKFDDTLRQILNPESSVFNVVAGAVGADVSRVWFTTHFTHAVFIDMVRLSIDLLRAALEYYARLPDHLTKAGLVEYRQIKYERGFGNELTFEDKRELTLAYELKVLGALEPGSNWHVDRNADGHLFITFRFPDDPVIRRITLVQTDILKPWPTVVKQFLLWANAYYQRAARKIAFSSNFLASVSQWVRPDGVLLIDPHEHLYDKRVPYYDRPDPLDYYEVLECLEQIRALPAVAGQYGRIYGAYVRGFERIYAAGDWTRWLELESKRLMLDTAA